MKLPLTHLYSAIFAGIVAGCSSTLVQIVLWLLFTDDFPAILWRDARLTAALALGSTAFDPSAVSFGRVMAIAIIIHFVLSICFAWAIGLATLRLPGCVGAAGLLLGAVLHAVNLHLWTLVFPWFAAARDWITLMAHLVFGVTAAMVFRHAALRRK